MLRMPGEIPVSSMTTIEDQLRRDLATVRRELTAERHQHTETSRKLLASIRHTQRWKRRALAAESALERVGDVLKSHAAEREDA